MATLSAASAGLAESVKGSPLLSTVSRLASVDILRGLVMVIMALDHTRDFITNIPFVPEALDRTFPALFYTRFVTHFCAPVFSFLAGTGAFLAASRGKSIRQVSWFFLTRGLWLVLLEITIVDFAWTFKPWAAGGVIWIIGWSMVVMAAVVRLPLPLVATFGIVTVAGHNLLDGIDPAVFGRLFWFWRFLHVPGPVQVTPNYFFLNLYVLVPWVGVMACGFAFGKLLLASDRRKRILTLGVALTVLFLVLRGFNLYGNGYAGFPFSTGHWSHQPTTALTVISFLNTEKYPPSLDYLLMTLGPSLILLGLLDGAKADRGLGRIFLVFGRVPLFYYVLHIYLIHIVAIVLALATHQGASWLWHGAIFLQQPPPGYGHGLGVIYVVWLAVVASLYLPCLWYMEFKSRHRDWNWLSYL